MSHEVNYRIGILKKSLDQMKMDRNLIERKIKKNNEQKNPDSNREIELIESNSKNRLIIFSSNIFIAYVQYSSWSPKFKRPFVTEAATKALLLG